jgi:hypothetical protein
VTLLVWRSADHFDHTRDLPCTLCRTLCRTPTPLRSHAGEPAHKVCAELWTSRHSDSARFRSDTTPTTHTATRSPGRQPKSAATAGDPWGEETLFDPA